jgi:hypothetical protein
MKDINCPYCDAEIDINHDDGHGYEENELHQQDCDSCGKTFVFTTSIAYYYEATKAECLNGVPHDYLPTHTYPIEFTEMECSMCGEKRKPTVEEMENIRGANKKVMI